MIVIPTTLQILTSYPYTNSTIELQPFCLVLHPQEVRLPTRRLCVCDVSIS
jgi:hypothetical protein